MESIFFSLTLPSEITELIKIKTDKSSKVNSGNVEKWKNHYHTQFQQSQQVYPLTEQQFDYL